MLQPQRIVELAGSATAEMQTEESGVRGAHQGAYTPGAWETRGARCTAIDGQTAAYVRAVRRTRALAVVVSSLGPTFLSSKRLRRETAQHNV